MRVKGDCGRGREHAEGRGTRTGVLRGGARGGGVEVGVGVWRRTIRWPPSTCKIG